MRAIWATEPHGAVRVAAIVVVSAVCPGLFIATSGWVVGLLARRAPGGTIVLGIAALGSVYGAQLALAHIRVACTADVARRVSRHFAGELIDTVTRPPLIAPLEDPEVVDHIDRARGMSWGGAAPGAFVEGMADQWAIRLGGIGAVLVVATFRWWLAALVVVVQLAGFRSWRRSFYSYLSSFDDVEGLRKARFLRSVAVDPDYAREVRLFGMADWVGARHRAQWYAALQPTWRGRRRISIAVGVAIAATGLVRLAGLLVLARAGVRGEVSVGQVAAVGQALLAAGQITAIAGIAELNIQRSIRATEASLWLRDRLQPQAAVTGVLPGRLPRHAIRFESVSFAYPGSDGVVLDGLDLELPAGGSLALVGDNGAGKTTVIKLLAGLYEPSGGRITVDGVDLRELPRPQWQRNVAALFQDFGRYPATVRDNVAWSSIEHRDDDDRVWSAIRRAGLGPAVVAMLGQLDTMLDRGFTGGVDLSGGQWQRVALARALFALDHGAGVLVLDEPTAQLDARAEARLYTEFLGLTAGATSVIVSHRFSTIRRAQHIVVIEGGRVVEAGSHLELVDLGGRYATAFRLQADAFGVAS